MVYSSLLGVSNMRKAIFLLVGMVLISSAYAASVAINGEPPTPMTCPPCLICP
jgi:hypothetical protein